MLLYISTQSATVKTFWETFCTIFFGTSSHYCGLRCLAATLYYRYTSLQYELAPSSHRQYFVSYIPWWYWFYIKTVAIGSIKKPEFNKMFKPYLQLQKCQNILHHVSPTSLQCLCYIASYTLPSKQRYKRLVKYHFLCYRMTWVKCCQENVQQWSIARLWPMYSKGRSLFCDHLFSLCGGGLHETDFFILQDVFSRLRLPLWRLSMHAF